MDRTGTIASVCKALSANEIAAASTILQKEYPLVTSTIVKRRSQPLKYIKTFILDGFIDRYSGERLVFPPVLRMLSYAMPKEFPFHPNWKTEATHPAYWELSATIDHVTPVARGGPDEPSNWVTTSMARNSAKGNWTLEELGWPKPFPRGDFRKWDGLLKWCLEYASDHPDAVSEVIKIWLTAGEQALKEYEAGLI